MKPLLPEASTSAIGYLILCIAFTGILVLVYDPTLLIFAVFLLIAFVIAASIDGGKPDKDLETVGWSGNNMATVIPLAIAGGMISFVAGLYITRNVQASVYSFPLQAFVPDFSTTVALTSIATASVIPPILSTAANILSQWFVVAPSEEALSKIVLPYAFNSIFKNWTLAYILGTLGWVLSHVPKFMAQGVDGRMYIVLLFLAFVNIVLVLFTRNVLAGVISHGVFNTDVAIYPGIDQPTFYLILIIVSVLVYIWVISKKANNPRRKAS